jgi:epoxide hydrolase 4
MSRTEDRTGGDLREGYAEVGDVRLHYVEAGDGAADRSAARLP